MWGYGDSLLERVACCVGGDCWMMTKSYQSIARNYSCLFLHQSLCPENYISCQLKFLFDHVHHHRDCYNFHQNKQWQWWKGEAPLLEQLSAHSRDLLSAREIFGLHKSTPPQQHSENFDITNVKFKIWWQIYMKHTCVCKNICPTLKTWGKALSVRKSRLDPHPHPTTDKTAIFVHLCLNPARLHISLPYIFLPVAIVELWVSTVP